MADFLLSVGVDVGLSYTEMQKDISALVSKLNSNPPKIKVGLDIDNTTLTNFRNQIDEISRKLGTTAAVKVTTSSSAQTIAQDTAAINANTQAKKSNAAAATQKAQADANATATAKQMDAAEKAYLTTIIRLESAIEKWTKAENSQNATSRESYRNLKEQAQALREVYAAYSQKTQPSVDDVNNLTSATSKANIAFKNTESVLKANGDATKSLTSRIGGLAEKFNTWFSISQVIMATYRAVRQMISSVIELDTAMTELKKVTDETDATYNQFLEDATVRAKNLGAALSDVVTASADFARLGFNIDQAEKLADAAIIYKNVGDGIDDISDASESIIATLQAFGDEVSPEDVMSIIDKFNEVGNNYAISSKGVGDALLRSAAAMNAANNSLDETIALATAANTVVQDPEKVGTTLKTVSMYLRAAKTEAEDAGESTDGMASSVSELRAEILALTGNKVDIQIDENSFKSTYQILKELSEEWDNLTDISQANILEMVGGKRNSNVIAALLENFSVAEKAIETSANSAGSALAENEKYLESIEGKISQFKAVFETFSQNLISSGLIKFIVELGTGILRVLDSLQRIHLLLPAIISAVALFKSVGIAKSLVESKAKTDGLAASLIKQKTATDTLAVSVSNLTLVEKKRLATDIQAAVASKQLTQTEANQILATLGLATAEGSLTVANKTLASSFKSLMASIPVWGWIALAVSVLIEVINGIAMAAGNSTDKISELDNELNELISTAQTAANDFSNLKSSADEVIPRFAELAKGVNEFGEKVDLTEEEYAEFLELNNKLAEMFPELDMGLDSNGNHILALSYSVDTLTESLEALLEAERMAANEEIAGNMKDTLKNMKSADKAYDKEIKTLQNRKEAHKVAAKEINDIYNNYSDEFKEMFPDWKAQADVDVSSYSVELQEAWGLYDGSATQESWANFVDKFNENGVIDWQALVNSDEMKNALVGIDREIANVEKKQEARWQNLNPIMGAWLQTTDDYNVADENVQQLLTKIIGNVDYSEIGITNEKKLKEYMTNNFVKPISEAEPEVQNAMVGLFDIKSAFDSGALTVGEYGIMDYILGDLQSAGVNEEILSNLNDALNLDEFQSQLEAVKNGINATDEEVLNFVNDLTFEDFNLVYSVIQEQGSMSIEELKEQIKLLRYEGANMVEPLNMTEFIDGLNETANAVDKVTSAMAKLKEGTALSKKEIVDLINQYPQLLQQADIFANGSVEAQKNALNAILDMQEQEYDAQIDAKIAELEATEQVLNNQLELEEQKANLINEIKNLEVNGKVTQEEDFLNKLNELNDLQGQNYVSLKDGELQVNEEALNDQLEMGSEFGEKSAESIWEPYGQTIVASHSQGYTGALTATNNYTASLYDRIKNFISNLGSAIATAWNDMWSGNWQGIGTYFKQATSTGSGSISGGTVSVNFGGTKTTINGQDVDEWISDQEDASKTRIEKINNIKAGVLNSIKNLEDLKGLNLTDIYASTSSSGSKDKDDEDEENIFKTMYNYHKHLVAMEQETTAEFLKWLDDAYKAAYEQGEITLDEYYKYEEEVFKGMQELRDEAKDTLEELIEFRIDMLKQDIKNEKEALEEKLDNLKEFYDKQKEMLQDQYDEEKRLEEQSEKRKTVSDIRAELSMLENDDSAWAQKRKLELQAELSDAESDLADFEKESALDKALNAIDEAYNSQEAQLEREMEALDEKLNDPNALYNQALNDIRNNSKNQLYYQMLMYNRQYGDGKDETIKELWESTYGALDEYEKMFGELYQGVDLKNETGYKPTTTTTTNTSSNKTSTTTTTTTPKTETKKEDKPSLEKGSYVNVKSGTRWYADSYGGGTSGTAKAGTIKYINTKGSHPYNIDGLGWVKKSDIVGYASGTKHATAGLHELYEQGSEMLFVSSSGGKYRILEDDDKVLNAKATNFLYDFANGGENALAQMLKNVFGGTSLSGITPSVISNEINMGDIIVQGHADTRTVSEIRRAQRESVDFMLREFTKLNK